MTKNIFKLLLTSAFTLPSAFLLAGAGSSTLPNDIRIQQYDGLHWNYVELRPTNGSTLTWDSSLQFAVAPGETVWTNRSGTIQPASGQTTNRLQFISGAADNATNAALVLDAASAWAASGAKLFQVKNGGTNKFAISPKGELLIGEDVTGNEGDLAIFRRETNGHAWAYTTSSFIRTNEDLVQTFNFLDPSGNSQLWLYDNLNKISLFVGEESVILDMDVGGGLPEVRLFPSASASTTPYKFGTSESHTSGNLVEFVNNGTNKVTVDFSGKVSTAGGFASSNTTAAVTIAETGWTNTFGVNAAVYIDGTGVTYTIKNNAGTSVYTNAATVAHATVLLQPNGAVDITAGTGVTGRATPF